MNKTAVIGVKHFFKHLIYNKISYFFKKYYVHDDFNFCSKNDKVYIIECKPYSKIKFWKIIKII
ncbi:30S ribosomal protein S17 [Candidatus Nasuia deltocephalinicola]|uniref:30S ribosomal protein S17 n=1 Tax=Candidatus Nasuia deltocephalincola TaxID=1160784 RepID=UPI00216AD777|nr:30S ribosomal protein S17 [Candidatus Nasuia deltocephalinicola]